MFKSFLFTFFVINLIHLTCGFWVSLSKLDWQNAIWSCKQAEMHLISIEDRPKMAAVHKYLAENEYFGDFWTSGHYSDIYDNWRWEDLNETMNNFDKPKFWYDQTPSKKTDGHAIYVFRDTKTGKTGWKVSEKRIEKRYMCEYNFQYFENLEAERAANRTRAENQGAEEES